VAQGMDGFGRQRVVYTHQNDAIRVIRKAETSPTESLGGLSTMKNSVRLSRCPEFRRFYMQIRKQCLLNADA